MASIVKNLNKVLFLVTLVNKDYCLIVFVLVLVVQNLEKSRLNEIRSSPTETGFTLMLLSFFYGSSIGKNFRLLENFSSSDLKGIDY